MKKRETKVQFENKKKRAQIIVKKLKALYPKIQISLDYSNNWELLVAVELSVQCTDKRVNIVTEKLFNKYKKLEDYVKANPTEFEKDIHSCGFFATRPRIFWQQLK